MFINPTATKTFDSKSKAVIASTLNQFTRAATRESVRVVNSLVKRTGVEADETDLKNWCTDVQIGFVDELMNALQKVKVEMLSPKQAEETTNADQQAH